MDKSPSYKIILLGCRSAAVVLLRTYTRLAGVGPGCPVWPGCYGYLSVPDTQEEIGCRSAAAVNAGA